ncbi:MAG: hypothetical protein R3E44_03140 [Paracoccaceae bacterium]
MDRRTFLITSVGLLVCGVSRAHAESIEDSVSRQLADQGYAITRRKRTLLGRVKVEAINGRRRREIVFDPTTGEILRDYTDLGDRDGADASGRSDQRGASRGGSSEGAGGKGEEEDEEDDGDDFEREGGSGKPGGHHAPSDADED